MIHAIDKKQMYDSVITRKENASRVELYYTDVSDQF